jgi:hypothetical protein
VKGRGQTAPTRCQQFFPLLQLIISERTRWDIITHSAALLPCIDFGDMHHDAGVMMGCGGDRRTAAYKYCLADQVPESPSHVFVGGEHMNRARSPDSGVAVGGIEADI